MLVYANNFLKKIFEKGLTNHPKRDIIYIEGKGTAKAKCQTRNGTLKVKDWSSHHESVEVAGGGTNFLAVIVAAK